jgi:hypothetical protein
MRVGYFTLNKIKDNGKALRHDLICEKCGQLINIDDFVEEMKIEIWDKEARQDLWAWIGEQHFHCEHYLKWIEEEKYWDEEWRTSRRYA